MAAGLTNHIWTIEDKEGIRNLGIPEKDRQNSDLTNLRNDNKSHPIYNIYVTKFAGGIDTWKCNQL